jgi:hypothetical protein
LAEAFLGETKMDRKLLAAVVTLGFLICASQAQAGWGRTLHPVVSNPPAATTTYYVPATTTYYPPATTYVAPAVTTYYPPVTTYSVPATTTYAVPATTVSPVVVARPVVTTPGYVIPPPRFRLRRDAPSLYVAPSVVVP